MLLKTLSVLPLRPFFPVLGPAIVFAFLLWARPLHAQNAVADADSLFSSGNLPAAVSLYWKNIENLDTKALTRLVTAHERLKQYPEMLRAANLLVGKAPKNPAALTLKGRAHIYLKQKAEAVEALQGALRANKSYRPAYEALLSLYSDNFSEKRIIYQDMLASFGRKPDLLKELCDLETDDGDNDAALKICSEAAKADPSNPLPSINIARVKFRTENREEGEKLLANISKQHPSSEVAQFFYAKNLLEQKRYLDAFTKFQDCLRVDRKSDRCWAGLGETAVQIEKHQVAHDAFRNACEINGSWSLEVRRAAQVLRKAKQLAWESRFMALAEACSQRGSR